jgi:hypothetical protein
LSSRREQNLKERRPYSIVKENLKGTKITLTSFYLNNSANVYAFSYEKEGKIKHTLVDSGDPFYRNEILSILKENGIDPANIERIIITHSHLDHLGLADVVARESGARILVEESFKKVVEGTINTEERRFFRGFDPSTFKKCDIQYLPVPGRNETRNISGISFSSLAEPISLGGIGMLEMLSPPKSRLTHSTDQVLVLYSPVNITDEYDLKIHNSWHPTDCLLFSGDLWLMQGPVYNRGMSFLFRRLGFYFYRMKNRSARNRFRRDFREEDPEAKNALKNGFPLVRVKPGHGTEFIGSRIIPNGLLADRDLLVKLGYSENDSKAILKQRDLAQKIAALKEQAYKDFGSELVYWLKMGYTPDEIAALLIRIYKEQSGGSAIVRNDRKQRRVILKATLARLKGDNAQPAELRQSAEAAILEL